MYSCVTLPILLSLLFLLMGVIVASTNGTGVVPGCDILPPFEIVISDEEQTNLPQVDLDGRLKHEQSALFHTIYVRRPHALAHRVFLAMKRSRYLLNVFYDREKDIFYFSIVDCINKECENRAGKSLRSKGLGVHHYRLKLEAQQHEELVRRINEHPDGYQMMVLTQEEMEKRHKVPRQSFPAPDEHHPLPDSKPMACKCPLNVNYGAPYVVLEGRDVRRSERIEAKFFTVENGVGNPFDDVTKTRIIKGKTQLSVIPKGYPNGYVYPLEYHREIGFLIVADKMACLKEIDSLARACANAEGVFFILSRRGHPQLEELERLLRRTSDRNPFPDSVLAENDDPLLELVWDLHKACTSAYASIGEEGKPRTCVEC